MMTTILHDLVEHLDLERIEDTIFRGRTLDIGGKSIFGGQVLGQALSAAYRTVSGRSVHSLHAYFLRPGDLNEPIIYDVERIRDGRSFTTRRIVAIQHGRPIFNMAASFQIDEDGFEHQSLKPDVPAPDELPSIVDLRQRMAELHPDKFKNRPAWKLPIDIRPIPPNNPYSLEKQPPFQKAWFRMNVQLSDDLSLHQCMLAYASDLGLLSTACLPHGISFSQKHVHAASLDHSIWFHRRFRVDQWLLYVMESPSASGSRGLALGKIFTQDGALVASVAQEGLMRVDHSRKDSAGGT